MNAIQSHDALIAKAHGSVVGVDEVGRGALAGPVFAAACRLSRSFFASEHCLTQTARINDSKKVSTKGREIFYTVIEELQTKNFIELSLGEASVSEIESLNILGATKLAMQRALDGLFPETSEVLMMPSPESEGAALLIDGRPLRNFSYPHTGIVGGDSKSLSIAISSIYAKVLRDRRMTEYSSEFPMYSFDQHKGYGTKKHRLAILANGPCSQHRSLFLRKIYAPSQMSDSHSSTVEMDLH